LWYRVLAARYGEEGGSIGNEGRLTSVWWSNVLSIKGGDGEGVGSWFTDHLQRKVGNGVGTLFWRDSWLEGGVLKDKFSHLFYLSDKKMATVADMFLLGWGEGGEAWKWRRRLLAWEEELVIEC